MTCTSPVTSPIRRAIASAVAGGVACDHDDSDTGGAAAAHRLGHLRPRRVEHAHEAQELEVALDLVGPVADACREHPAGEREHAKRLALHVGRRCRGLRLLRERERRAREDDLDGALHVCDAVSAGEVDGAHALPLGAERQLREAREPGGFLRMTEAALLGDDEERALGRIADDRPRALRLGQPGVVAEDSGAQELAERRRVDDAPVDPEAAEGLIADPFDLDRPPRRPEADDGHLVLRERARLVGADDGRLAERLDRRRGAGRGRAAAPCAGGDGERERHRRQEPFRHEGDHDADGEDEAVGEAHARGSPRRQRTATRSRSTGPRRAA